jgi:hypothetical protein
MLVRDGLCPNIWRRVSEYGKDLKEVVRPEKGQKFMENSYKQGIIRLIKKC